MTRRAAHMLLRSAGVLLLVGSILPARALTCNVRTSPMSPGDIAMSHADYAKAETLYAAEWQATGKSGPEAGRLHAALIRAQLHGSKIADAEKDVTAWSTAQPKNAWAVVALTEVQWREGKANDAFQTIKVALSDDYCNPEAHAVLANMYREAGLYASANRELTKARQIDPIDDDIQSDWIRLQPRAAQLTELTRYLEQSTFLSDDERKSLMKWKDRLSAPAASSCHLVTPVTNATIPFRRIQENSYAPIYWGLDVSFNGKRRSLEIDTGASGLILTRSAANALHLQPEDKFKVGGIGDGGDVDFFVVKVDSIKIGSLEFQDCDVSVMSKTPESMSDLDGFIGGDVFSSFVFTLDFPGHTLKLSPLPPRPGETDADNPSLDTGTSASSGVPQDAYIDSSMKDWDRIWRSGHDLIMPVRLNSATGPRRLFILDTGSQVDLISPDAAREVGKVSKGSWVEIRGISGEVKKTWTTGPMTLYFSHFGAPSDGMFSIDTSSLGKETGMEISGLIGAPTLHQLTFSIDYRDNLVHFTYDPNRITHCVPGIKMADCY